LARIKAGIGKLCKTVYLTGSGCEPEPARAIAPLL